MIEIVPIAASGVSWNNLLKAASGFTGHKINKSVDASKIKLSDYDKIIMSLDELSPQSSQAHLFFSFLILAPASFIFSLHEKTHLIISSSKSKERNHKVSIISGSLGEWRSSLLVIPELSALLPFFNKAGLRQYFR